MWEGNGTALNIIECKVNNVHPNKFIDYFKNVVTLLPQYNKKVKLTPIDSDGPFQIVHQRYTMPFMISTRSFFNTYYHIDGCEPGEYQHIASGRGNEEFIEKHKRLAGRDVIGNILINFISVRPVRNKEYQIVGTFIQQV